MPLEARHCPRSKAELERRIREAVSVLERASENGEILSVCSSTPTQRALCDSPAPNGWPFSPGNTRQWPADD